MRKLIITACFAAIALAGSSQIVHKFHVGPYEVNYLNRDEYDFKLRENIDLNEYFGLAKDTTINNVVKPTKPISHGFQVNAAVSMPRFVPNGCSNVFGLEFHYKHQIYKALSFNVGVSASMMCGKYSALWNHVVDNTLEAGMPISLEVSKPDLRSSSLFVKMGVTPFYYNILRAENRLTGTTSSYKGLQGMVVAPRMDFGAYVPFEDFCSDDCFLTDRLIFCIGTFAQYNIQCTKGANIYRDRIGRFFMGAYVGLIF